MKPATLSDDVLPPLDLSIPPWPGETVVIDGVGTYVRRTPGPPHGPTAVYVHGLGGSSTNWTDLAAQLSGRLHGEAPDLPGFGRSGPVARRDYSLPALARRVARFVELGGCAPVHLVGNSLGGAVCVVVAAVRPELVRTLTLVSPALPDWRVRRLVDPAAPLVLLPGVSAVAERRLARLSPLQRVRGVIDMCYADPASVPDHRLAEAAEEVRRRDAEPWAMEALVQSLRGLVRAWAAPPGRSLWRQARRISAPTLVVWGRQDRLVDVRLAARAARVIPDSRLLVLDDVGHVAQLERPREVARAILALIDEASPA